MSVCTVTLTANAGVCLKIGEHRVWIDALHTDKAPGFSSVTPEIWAKIKKRADLTPPEYICFTHCHSDHYDCGLARKAKVLWPQTGLLLPRRDFPDQLTLSMAVHELSSGDLNLKFRRLPHEGGVPIPHYGILLECGGFRVLIPGDCAVEDDTFSLLSGWLRDCPDIDLAILNFLWVTKRAGRDFLEKTLRPRHILICHLPFEEDETNRYRHAAQRGAERLHCPDVRLLMEPLQTEII